MFLPNAEKTLFFIQMKIFILAQPSLQWNAAFAMELQIENLYLTFNLNTKYFFLQLILTLTHTNEDKNGPVVEVCEGCPNVDQTSIGCQGGHHGGEHSSKPDPGLGARDILK